MNYGRYNWSHLFLSVGLGAFFLWTGQDILRNPNDWIEYLPSNIPLGLDKYVALKIGGVFDIVLGGLLIIRWWPKIVASLAVIHFLGIFITHGIDPVAIRDVGVFGASLSLLVWPKRHHRSHNAA